jgi:TatD DNase family protein
VAAERDRKPTFAGGDDKPLVLPDLGAATADAHAHLDMLDDPAGALARASAAGIALVASVVDLTEDPRKTLDGLDGWLRDAAGRETGPAVPDVVLVAGVHPHNARLYDDGVHESLAVLVRGDSRVAALGELGLDFHYDHSPRDAQREMFSRQLALAHELDVPVIVHLREAHEEGAAILSREGVPKAGCVIHCFTEGPDLATRFLELSDAVLVSFAGPVTFSKADQIRRAVAVVPLDRLLVETDSPFLTPVPYRGRPNEPALAVLNAAKVAEVLGVDPAEVASATLANARRLFRLSA